MKIDVVFAVEDPGAANFILDMPEELNKINYSSAILTFGNASKFLTNKGIHNFNCSNIKNVHEILEGFSFEILVAGTSQNSNSIILKLIKECRSNSIYTIGVVDMAADSNLRFKGNSKESLFYAPEFLIVPDELTLKNFVYLGFNERNIFKLMHPALTRLKNKACLIPKEFIDNKRKSILKNFSEDTEIWLFAFEHNHDQRLFRDSQYTIKGRNKSNKRINIILEEILEIKKTRLVKPFFILRLHPKNQLEDYIEYLDEIDLIDDSPDPLELILCSDIVIGSTTIFLLEAAYLGKPTLSIIPKKGEEEWSPSIVNKMTPYAYTTEQIISELDGYKKNHFKEVKIDNKISISTIIKRILKSS